MFIKNLAAKPIKEISFEGYFFTIPVGVSVCWDKFGEFLFKNIYKIEGDGGGVPAVIQATQDQWKGALFVEVKRFPINHEQIPARKDLLKLAKQRGVDAVTLELWNEDETIETKEIAEAVNNLSVPENIAFPKVGEEVVDAEAQAAATAAEDALKGDDKKKDGGNASAPADKVTAPTAKAPKTPSTGGKSGSGKTVAKKAAAKAPKTPTTPKKK